MVTKNQRSKIIDHFIEYVYEECEIRLSKYDLSLEISGSMINVNLSGYEISSTELDRDYLDEADTAIRLLESSGDIKERLKEIKVEELDKNLKSTIQEFRDYLKQKLLNPEQVEDLTIEVGEVGYDRKHWETDDEAESGYPIIGLIVTNYDKIDFAFPLNIYYPEDSIDFEELKTEFENYLTKENII